MQHRNHARHVSGYRPGTRTPNSLIAQGFDITRNARGHVAFEYGSHQCIGANLARAEMHVPFATLAHRLPALRLAVPHDELKFKEADIYGTKELPVIW